MGAAGNAGKAGGGGVYGLPAAGMGVKSPESGQVEGWGLEGQFYKALICYFIDGNIWGYF